jgi:hypothetical protein
MGFFTGKQIRQAALRAANRLSGYQAKRMRSQKSASIYRIAETGKENQRRIVLHAGQDLANLLSQPAPTSLSNNPSLDRKLEVSITIIWSVSRFMRGLAGVQWAKTQPITL